MVATTRTSSSAVKRRLSCCLNRFALDPTRSTVSMWDMNNANSSKVADMSNILPGEMDDVNPFDLFDDEDEERLLKADEDFLAYLQERAQQDLAEQLAYDSWLAGE